MRPIDADALHKAYMELRNFKQDPQSGDWISLRAVPLTTVIRMLNDTPSIDIEPKRGEWMPIIEANEFGEVYQAGIYCSECGETLGCEANFCPNCGADMRERKESE